MGKFKIGDGAQVIPDCKSREKFGTVGIYIFIYSLVMFMNQKKDCDK